MTTISDHSSADEVLLRSDLVERPGPFLRLLHAGDAHETFSYGDVMVRARRWRSLYASRGLEPGDRVVIVLQHSLDLYASFLGALIGGFVPAMFAFPTPKFSERAYFDTVGQLLDNAQPKLLIAFEELLPKLSPWVGRCEGLLSAVAPREVDACQPSTDGPCHRREEQTAFLQYSSGTTGLRKGVAISHRALLWQVREYGRAIGLGKDDVVVSWLPLYHDMGLVACFLLPFLAGCPLIAMSAFDWVKRPSLLLRALSEHRGTLCWLPNFAYNFMARAIPAAELEGVNLTHVRGFVNCSEPVMAESHRAFLARFSAVGVREEALAVSYAMAENTFAVTSAGFGRALHVDWVDARALATGGVAARCPEGAANARPLVSCGSPLADTVVEIVDGAGRALSERHVGEIVLRSPCLLSEYFRNEIETDRSIKDGRYFTGDVGYVAEGEVYVTGRAKDMIIVGGQNVFPQDVEAIVNAVAGVHPGRCVALGLLDERAGTESLIVIAETSAASSEQERIRREILDSIASQTDIVASDVLLVEHMWLHKSSSGKIARAENLRRYRERIAETSSSLPEASPSPGAGDDVTAQVMRAVQRVLDQTPSNRRRVFGVRDPIISSGAIDSFGLVNLLLEIERAFGVRIPDHLAEVAKLDTAELIAQTLSELGDQAPAAPDVPQSVADVVLRIDRDKVFAAQPGSDFWTLYYRTLFRLRGIRYGHNLQVKGPLILRLGTRPENLQIGDEVTLMPGVDLKLRDQGSIVIGSGVQLDSSVRLVAANRARILLGDNVRVGMGTIVNAGADFVIGRGTLIASSCIMDSSEHRFEGREPVSAQGFVHAPVLIGEDVWVGARVFVELGSRIGKGAVVGVGSVVNGDITAFGVAMGSPARVIKMRR